MRQMALAATRAAGTGLLPENRILFAQPLQLGLQVVLDLWRHLFTAILTDPAGQR